MNETTTIFIYGTLKKGFGNHALLEKSKFLGKATVEGYLMYALSSFIPCVTKSSKLEDKIHGEVYTVDSLTLSNLDALEGNGSFYIRKPVTCTMESGEQKKVQLYEIMPNIIRGQLYDPVQGGIWHKNNTK